MICAIHTHYKSTLIALTGTEQVNIRRAKRTQSRTFIHSVNSYNRKDNRIGGSATKIFHQEIYNPLYRPCVKRNNLQMYILLLTSFTYITLVNEETEANRIKTAFQSASHRHYSLPTH
ncbi:CLUMA_CG018289, isoform A [Clunio marinus]|uniref:CLUMA_CG018289, isoform A n=1 Tax=Clunio marinus TaxID=568069 RepID=A0A1J1IZK1_9DIPT|nr:CLUMA_CG018289, isoform A [Clunio marinus]